MCARCKVRSSINKSKTTFLNYLRCCRYFIEKDKQQLFRFNEALIKCTPPPQKQTQMQLETANENRTVMTLQIFFVVEKNYFLKRI